MHSPGRRSGTDWIILVSLFHDVFERITCDFDENLMKSSIFKPWFIALLLLAFTSQSMAALTMVCEMPQQIPPKVSQDSAHTSHDIDHAHMSHMSAPSDSAEHQNFSDAHCATMEHCTSGSCVLPALSHQLSINAPVVTAVVIDSVDSGFPVASISSLYRPPISR